MNAPEQRLEPRLTSLSHGGGCGCKIAPGVLREILRGARGMPIPPQLLVGIETADDAAVYQLNDEQALIATTDFFMPIVDDPFDFGRIAATNAISDVYAMGGTPIMALALVGMPINVLSTETIGRILEGRRKRSAPRSASRSPAATPSIRSKPIYGLVVMGLVHPQRVKRNADAKRRRRARARQAARRRRDVGGAEEGALGADGYARMIASTTQLNTPGPDLAAMAGVHALTDVTGFGLAGHALELARGSQGCGVRIEWARVPLLAGVRDLAAAGPGDRRVGPQLGRLRRRRDAARGLRRRRQGAADRPADQRRAAGVVRAGRGRRGAGAVPAPRLCHRRRHRRGPGGPARRGQARGALIWRKVGASANGSNFGLLPDGVHQGDGT